MNHLRLTVLALALAMVAFAVSGCHPKPAQLPPAPPQQTTPTPAVTTPKTTDTTPSTTTTPSTNTNTTNGTVSALQMVHFGYDSSVLDDAAHAVLDADARILAANPSLRAVVEGHCDERGSVEYNIALGEKRAKAVIDYLTNGQVPASQLKAISYGKEQPLDPSENEAAYAKNRRAQFSEWK